MARRSVIYDDFSKGEFGRLTAYNAPKGSWTGMNMLVYRTGELGVRAGLKNITPSGLVNGNVWDVGVHGGIAGQRVWFGQGTAVREFNPYSLTPSITTLSGTLTGTPFAGNDVGQFPYGDNVYIATGGEGAYVIDSGAVTALTGSPDGWAIAQIGDRLLIASASGNTIRYSDANNFNSWPVNNSIAVGGTGTMAFGKQRNHLSIFKTGDGIFVLTGVPGVNEVLRQASLYGFSPSTMGRLCVAAETDIVWAMPPSNVNGPAFPLMWDGSKLTELREIPSPSVDSPDARVIALPWLSDGGAVYVGQQVDPIATLINPTLLYHRGSFSRHTFDSAIEIEPAHGVAALGGFFLPDPADASSLTHEDMVGLANAVVMTDAGGASATPVFWSWAVGIDRPGSETAIANTIQERAGDNSDEQVTGYFSLPEWWSDEGSEIMVRSVIVDFRSWDTGGSLTNHFDVAVDTLRWFDNDAPNPSDTLSWDEDGSLSSTAGTLKRRVFGFGDQGVGNGFQIHLTNCRGIAVRRIQVVIESQPARGN